MTDPLEQACQLLQTAKFPTVLSGAGISRESGIPTFREAQTGLWAQYDPEKLATPHGFLQDPSLVWRWYDWRRQKLAEVAPNQGHYALVQLEAVAPQLVIITQNVDGLHKAAGSRKVIELHGNISRLKCFDHHHPANDIPLGLPEPPTCHCGSLLRPDVVWFGEMLPESELRAANEAAHRSDLMLVIGTSGLVHPAASLPYLAKQNSAKIIEINPEQTVITEIADIALQGPSAKILPALLSKIQAVLS